MQSSGGGGSPYVWIKLEKDQDFARLCIEGAAFVGHITTTACKQFPCWHLDAGQVRLFRVAKAGTSKPELLVPDVFADQEALAVEATLESAGVAFGDFLVAVPTATAGWDALALALPALFPAWQRAHKDAAVALMDGSVVDLLLDVLQRDALTPEQLITILLRLLTVEEFSAICPSPAAFSALVWALRDAQPGEILRLLTPPNPATPSGGGSSSGESSALLAAVEKMGADMEQRVEKMGADMEQRVEKMGADILAAVMLAQEADVTSYMSPTGKEYETLVDTKIDGWLAEQCGLEVLAARRGIPSTDEISGGFHWDACYSVLCPAEWVQPPLSALMRTYGGGQYARPAPIPPRQISPAMPRAEYFAVLESTRFPSWTVTWRTDCGAVRESLLLRLEKRLLLCIQRAGAAELTTTSILDLVAVVGVVSREWCQEAEVVEAVLSKADCPHSNLRSMYLARRFVFFQCTPSMPAGQAIQ